MSEPCKNCGGVKQQQFGSPLSPCLCEPSEIDRLRAEIASLKEELDEAYISRNGWKRNAEKCLGDVNALTQQLAAANGRVEMLQKALEYGKRYEAAFTEGVPRPLHEALAALSNLNEDRDKSDV